MVFVFLIRIRIRIRIDDGNVAFVVSVCLLIFTGEFMHSVVSKYVEQM